MGGDCEYFAYLSSAFLFTFLIPVDNWNSGMQEAEEDGHHWRLRSVREDQAA